MKALEILKKYLHELNLCKYDGFDNKTKILIDGISFQLPPCFRCSRQNADRYEPKVTQC